MKDLKKLKVHLPENFDENELIKGFGEPVCFIVNDLTNRELIRRKFSFNTPDFENLYNWDHQVDFNDNEEDLVNGSTVFDNTTTQ